MRGATGEGLEEEIIQNIPGTVSEIYSRSEVRRRTYKNPQSWALRNERAHMRRRSRNRLNIGALASRSVWQSNIFPAPLRIDRRWFPSYYRPRQEPFFALPCISYFGISEVASALTKINKWNVNQRDDEGVVALIYMLLFHIKNSRTRPGNY